MGVPTVDMAHNFPGIDDFFAEKRSLPLPDARMAEDETGIISLLDAPLPVTRALIP